LNDRTFNDDAKRASLENILAIASNKRGEIEAALSIWRRLVRHPEKLEPGERAWVWRNLGLALPHNDPEARQAARLSVDAFLEAGDKVEAARSLMHLSRLLEYENPDTALALYTSRFSLCWAKKTMKRPPLCVSNMPNE
jgi:hypothetical protein